MGVGVTSPGTVLEYRKIQPVNGGNGLPFRFRDDLAICLEFLVSFVSGGKRQARRLGQLEDFLLT
jgi:hypothetical protein